MCVCVVECVVSVVECVCVLYNWGNQTKAH